MKLVDLVLSIMIAWTLAFLLWQLWIRLGASVTLVLVCGPKRGTRLEHN